MSVSCTRSSDRNLSWGHETGIVEIFERNWVSSAFCCGVLKRQYDMNMRCLPEGIGGPGISVGITTDYALGFP